MGGRALPSPELNLAKMRKTLFVDRFDWRPGTQAHTDGPAINAWQDAIPYQYRSQLNDY